MPHDPGLHHRRSLRLKGYDYSQAGAYFVTICVQDHQCLFGAVEDGEMRLNRYGEAVAKAWEDLPAHYVAVELDAFVVMPNHVHAIVVLGDLTVPTGADLDGRAGLRPAPTQEEVSTSATLSEIVRAFKTFSARAVNQLRHTPGAPLWQRNYYDHVIRSERSLQAIREYVASNPLCWELDELHPVKYRPS